MAEDWKDNPSRRLDKLLVAAELSNVAVAKALGVSDSTVCRWRSGERAPNADTLAAILELCGGSADDVLGLTPLLERNIAERLDALRAIHVLATTALRRDADFRRACAQARMRSHGESR